MGTQQPCSGLQSQVLPRSQRGKGGLGAPAPASTSAAHTMTQAASFASGDFVERPRLFGGFTQTRPESPEDVRRPAAGPGAVASARLEAAVDEQILDLFRVASNPGDPFELRDLYLARAEAQLLRSAAQGASSRMWRNGRARREIQPAEILTSRALPRMVKELFNYFFRDDLYGRFRSADHLILSSGSVDEERYGLPASLKHTISYALDRDWYGYSDSRGRGPARQAVAVLENMKIPGAPYTERNIAISMGGTFAMSALADFLLSGHKG